MYLSHSVFPFEHIASELLYANRKPHLFQYGDSREFLWRLARAYSDVYKCTENKQEKKMYALQGNGAYTAVISHQKGRHRSFIKLIISIF